MVKESLMTTRFMPILVMWVSRNCVTIYMGLAFRPIGETKSHFGFWEKWEMQIGTHAWFNYSSCFIIQHWWRPKRYQNCSSFWHTTLGIRICTKKRHESRFLSYWIWIIKVLIIEFMRGKNCTGRQQESDSYCIRYHYWWEMWTVILPNSTHVTWVSMCNYLCVCVWL